MQDRLKELENDSVFIIREAFSKVKSLGLLWSMGKDSTVLMHLVRKAFMGNVPIPVVHVDTSYKIPAMIEWRDNYAREHNLNLIVGQNKEALDNGMHPDKGRLVCCGALKTEALLQTIKDAKLQGLLLGIRGDEEGSRGKERIVSPRSDAKTWSYKDQPAEIWQHYNLHVPKDIQLRIHPLLRWTEMDIWNYIKAENLEVMPLYFADEQGKRFRSLGCWPCTGNVDSKASNIDEILVELTTTTTSERAGRAQDKADRYAMQELRKDGYM